MKLVPSWMTDELLDFFTSKLIDSFAELCVSLSVHIAAWLARLFGASSCQFIILLMLLWEILTRWLLS